MSEHSHFFLYVLRLVRMKNPGPLLFELTRFYCISDWSRQNISANQISSLRIFTWNRSLRFCQLTQINYLSVEDIQFQYKSKRYLENKDDTTQSIGNRHLDVTTCYAIEQSKPIIISVLIARGLITVGTEHHTTLSFNGLKGGPSDLGTKILQFY